MSWLISEKVPLLCIFEDANVDCVHVSCSTELNVSWASEAPLMVMLCAGQLPVNWPSWMLTLKEECRLAALVIGAEGHEGAISPLELAHHLETLAASAGVADMILAGYGFSAGVALSMALRKPELIHSLLLCDDFELPKLDAKRAVFALEDGSTPIDDCASFESMLGRSRSHHATWRFKPLNGYLAEPEDCIEHFRRNKIPIQFIRSEQSRTPFKWVEYFIESIPGSSLESCAFSKLDLAMENNQHLAFCVKNFIHRNR